MASECLDILGSSFSIAYEWDAKTMKVKKKMHLMSFPINKKIDSKILTRRTAYKIFKYRANF